MLQRIKIWVFMFAIMLLTACGSAGAPDVGGTSGTGIVGSFTRSGGLQGLTETLTVHSDGTVTLSQGEGSGAPYRTAQVPNAQVQSLQAVFASKEWQQLEGSYGQQVPDGFQYTISANGKQVQTYDGAQHPAILDTALNQLNNLWQVVQAGQ